MSLDVLQGVQPIEIIQVSIPPAEDRNVTSPISASGGSTSLEGAMVNKIKEVSKIQDRAALDLIKAAAAPKPADSGGSTGKHIDVYA